MASHRPYRPSLGMDKAMEEIKEKRGRFMTLMWWMLVSGFSAKTNSPSNNLRERGTEAQRHKAENPFSCILLSLLPLFLFPFQFRSHRVIFLSCLNRLSESAQKVQDALDRHGVRCEVVELPARPEPRRKRLKQSAVAWSRLQSLWFFSARRRKGLSSSWRAAPTAPRERKKGFAISSPNR